METHNQYQRIVPFIIFVLALFLLFKLVQPMITILLSSILIAYISFPLYKRILKKIKNKPFSIMLSLFIVVTIIILPFAFLAFEITQQGYYFYNSLSDKEETGKLLGFECVSEESKVCALLNQAEIFSRDSLSKIGFDKQLQKFIPIIGGKMTDFVLSLPIVLAGILLSLVISYFVLKDWEVILEKISDLLPVRNETKKRLMSEFGSIAYTVVFAQLFVALVQGVVGAIGFYIFGVPFPIFLGAMLAFCALIPTIGTAIVWLPASIFLILSGHFSNDPWMLGKGIGLLVYGIFIISTIDNVLLPKIVHTKTKVSQIVVIVGVIGGADMFGIPGIFIGPILLALLMTYFETFNERFCDK